MSDNKKDIKRKNVLINSNSHNIYKKRLTRNQWVKRNITNFVISFITLFIIFYVGLSIASNYFSFTQDHSKYSWSDWKNYVVMDVSSTLGIILLVVTIIVPILLCLVFFMNFLRKVFKKSNWVLDERGGTAQFLTDERLPWTQFSKIENDYFPRTFFLNQGDWILRLIKQEDYVKFFEDASKHMKFNEKDAMKTSDVLSLLINPLGRYEEKIKYTSANDVLTDFFRLSSFKVSDSKQTWKLKLTEFLNKKQLLPFEIETAGDAPNAFVIGSTGSGKTTKLNYPTIIANANSINQPSMLISDPKGELYAKLSGYLTARGYEPYSLDLFDLIRSMGWNPLQDVYSKFVAKSLLKQYLKQYDEWKRYYNSHYDLDKDEVVIDKDILNETIGMNYPALTKDEYNYLSQRMIHYNMNKSTFVFDDRFVNNTFALQTDLLHFKVLTKDSPELGNYVCSIHTLQKANDCHTCYPNAEMYLLFDNYVFLTENALRIHLTTTLPTQISEQINVIKNAIFNSEGESDKHWTESAGKVFNGGLYTFGYRVEDDINSIPLAKFNIFSLISLINDDEIFNEEMFSYIIELEDYISQIKQSMEYSNDYTEYELKLYENKLQEYKTRTDFVLLNPIFKTGDRERGSIKSVLSTRLNPFTNDGVKLLTSFSDITFQQLTDDSKPKVIFIGINVNDPTYHAFITLFISTLHQKLSEKAKKTPANPRNGNNAGCLNRRFLFMLDEFGNIPPIPNLGRILSTCRSEGIKFMLIVQSIGQIQKNYKDDKQTIITNCPMNVFIKTDEFETAKYYSDVLGKTTIETEDVEADRSNNERIIPKTHKRFAFNTRSLMEPNELYNIDCSYYHDTLFITKVKQSGTIPIMIQVAPWYKTFNTKDFETYRPIQYKENKYSILYNQTDNNSLVNFYNKKNYLSQYDVVYKNVNVSENKDAKLNEEQIQKIKDEIESKIQTLDEQEFNQTDKIYDYVDLLISTYNLKFNDSLGMSLQEFEATLDSYEDFVSKQLLYQFWNVLGCFNFNFTKEKFILKINDYLQRVNQSNNITESEIKTYTYNFSENSINEFFIIQAKSLLLGQNSLSSIKNSYPNVYENMLRINTYLEYIFTYELTEYVVSTTDNDLQYMYNFLTRYKNENNINISEFSKFIKSLVSLVDKEIVNQYQIFFRDIMKVSESFHLEKFSQLQWYKNLITKFKDDENSKLLFISYWNSLLRETFYNNKDKLDGLF